MKDGDDLDRLFTRKSAILAWIGFPIAYVIALLRYPAYWAVATGVVFVIASGLFTTKVLLGLDNPWTAFGLAPICGAAWLMFLWLLFKLAG